MEIVLLLIVLCLVAPEVWAQVTASADARSLDLPMVTAYIWVALWGAIGGLVSFHQKVRQGKTRWLNINELIGEVMTSAFVGLGTGLLCVWAGTPAPLTYALVGITGHMGGRAIFWAENALQQWAEHRFGISPIESDPDPVGTAAAVVAKASALADIAARAAAALAATTADTSHALDPEALSARQVVHDRAADAQTKLFVAAAAARALVKDTAVEVASHITPETKT